MSSQTIYVIITGRALFDDENLDCIEDPTTLSLANRYIDIEPGGGTFTDANGFYLFQADASIYDLTISPYASEEGLCPANNTLTVSASTPGHSYPDNDFFLEDTGIDDLCTWVCMGPARPGFNQWHTLYYCNFGTEPASGTVSITHDELFTNFDANSNEDSYDPNDKMNFSGADALGGDTLISDSVFHYQIRFQNTGTDTAFTVVLLDVIDSNLDVSSIIPIGASHEFRLDLENEKIGHY